MEINHISQPARHVEIRDDEGNWLANGWPLENPNDGYAWTQGPFVPVVNCSISDMVLRLQEEYK